MTLAVRIGQILKQGKALLPDGDLHILILGEDVYPDDAPASFLTGLQELADHLQKNPQPILGKSKQFKRQDEGWASLLALPIMYSDELFGVWRHASPQPDA